MRDSAIIVPCYNEAARLQQDAFLDYARLYEAIHFIFVNDCSTDTTALTLDALCARLPGQCTALHLPRNMGKAGAVRAGFLKAFEGRYDTIGFWDADLATPLAEIDRFRSLVADHRIQMVLGARVRLLSRRIERRAARHYLGRFFATLASFTLGLTVYDTQCGAKLFVNNPILRQVFALPFTVNWIFDVEILARYILLTRYQGGRPLAEIACEYPLQEWRDVPGSKLKAGDYWVAAYEMAKIWQMLRGSGSHRYYERLVTTRADRVQE